MEDREIDYVGYEHEDSRRVVLYADEDDEQAIRFNLSDIVDTELDRFSLENGMTDSAAKPLFDALRFELEDMLKRIKAIRYG